MPKERTQTLVFGRSVTDNSDPFHPSYSEEACARPSSHLGSSILFYLKVSLLMSDLSALSSDTFCVHFNDVRLPLLYLWGFFFFCLFNIVCYQPTLAGHFITRPISPISQFTLAELATRRCN